MSFFLIIEAAGRKQTFGKLINHRFDPQPINCNKQTCPSIYTCGVEEVPVVLD